MFPNTTLITNLAITERLLKDKVTKTSMRKKWASAYTVKVFHFLFQDGKSSHELVCSVSYC
jgi:hypothetical protein